jgi:subtilisin family serine protease
MKIAIIDSGFHRGHPHLGEIAGAVEITAEGVGEDATDRLGHGTAVAAAIQEKAPDAELYIVKVFDRRLSTKIAVILHALGWCREHEMDLVNLSLGTQNLAHRDPLVHAIAGGPLIVSASNALPGSLEGVVGVAADPDCPRDVFRYYDGMFYASPYPRPIPGVPVAHNLHGASFAVANMTGTVARAFHGAGPPDRGALIALADNTVARDAV